MITGGTAIIFKAVLGIASVMGLGLGTTAAFQYFHAFEFKPRSKKEKGGGESDGKREAFSEKARSFSQV
jgi:hypothetical protein